MAIKSMIDELQDCQPITVTAFSPFLASPSKEDLELQILGGRLCVSGPVWERTRRRERSRVSAIPLVSPSRARTSFPGTNSRSFLGIRRSIPASAPAAANAPLAGSTGRPPPPRSDPHGRHYRMRLLSRIYGVKAHTRLRMQEVRFREPMTRPQKLGQRKLENLGCQDPPDRIKCGFRVLQRLNKDTPASEPLRRGASLSWKGLLYGAC